jgi:exopolyphosphatase/guanosine-5'-triphosphate,3'-diphosphate pyrophosphatase
MNVRRIGAIDIGSNSVRLLITDVLDYNGRAIFKKDSLIRIPLKLGEDTFSTGYISEGKKEKLAILMQSFRGLIQVNDVQIWRACATSAIREALNSDDVLKYVTHKSGIEIDVIDYKEEARFIMTNSIDELFEENRAYIYTDVGGGNTDLIIFHQNKEIISESFKLGTIRSLSPEEEKTEWFRMRNWLIEHSREFVKISLIGSGGNINKLDSLLRRCGRIRREELVSFAAKLKKMTYEERVVNLKINLNRAEVILPAIEIYLKVMKLARALVIETPIIGVADGIIKDLYMTHFYQEKASEL